MDLVRQLRQLCMALAISPLLCSSALAQTAAGDIVLWTSTVTAADMHGDWTRLSDSTAAGGVMLLNPDRGQARVAPALASPTNYFEMRFTAQGHTPYRLWIRMRAQNDSLNNDSIHLQFGDTINAAGQAVTRIGTTSSAEVVLQDGPNGPSPHDWGWTDYHWGDLAEPIYFAADGTHVLRIQQREDGAAIDQIVLSRRTYEYWAPGDSLFDSTVLSPAGGTSTVTAPSTPALSSSTVVIRPATAAAGRIYGNWHVVADASAAGGQAIRNPDAGAAKIDPALAAPISYFEATFNASAGRAYHLWLRVRADGDVLTNDSIHVQFNDSLTSSGTPVARIGTTSSFEPGLLDGPNATAVQSWGWTDNGWGALGPHIYFATTGPHTIRVQQREDGPRIDQIVLSPDTYLTTSPGSRLDDQTILPASESAPAPAENLPPSIVLTSPASGAAFTAPATITLSASTSDPEGRLAGVDFYNGSTWLATDLSAPFTFTWSGVPAGTYQVRALAVDTDGASTWSSIASITVGATSSSTLTRRVAFTASADHAIVIRYVMDVYLSTATIGVTPPLTSSDLGKPLPNSANEIIVDRTTLLNSLLPGTYRITVSAVGSGGSSRSSPITFTR